MAADDALEQLRLAPIDVRLEALARKLRAEGAIFGPERDLMMDAAALLRAAREEQD